MEVRRDLPVLILLYGGGDQKDIVIVAEDASKAVTMRSRTYKSSSL